MVKSLFLWLLRSIPHGQHISSFEQRCHDAKPLSPTDEYPKWSKRWRSKIQPLISINEHRWVSVIEINIIKPISLPSHLNYSHIHPPKKHPAIEVPPLIVFYPTTAQHVPVDASASRQDVQPAPRQSTSPGHQTPSGDRHWTYRDLREIYRDLLEIIGFFFLRVL